MHTAQMIEKFLANNGAWIVIAIYFGGFFALHILTLISNAKREQQVYEAQYQNVEGIAEIYKQKLAGIREPNFLDYLKIALLKYADVFTKISAKYGKFAIASIATICAIAFLVDIVVNVVVKAGV